MDVQKAIDELNASHPGRKLTNAEKTERYKAWCLKNYERGADTMVECWDTTEWEEFNEQNPTFASGMKALRMVASVYRERQADARQYEDRPTVDEIKDDIKSAAEYDAMPRNTYEVNCTLHALGFIDMDESIY